MKIKHNKCYNQLLVKGGLYCHKSKHKLTNK